MLFGGFGCGDIVVDNRWRCFLFLWWMRMRWFVVDNRWRCFLFLWWCGCGDIIDVVVMKWELMNFWRSHDRDSNFPTQPSQTRTKFPMCFCVWSVGPIIPEVSQREIVASSTEPQPSCGSIRAPSHNTWLTWYQVNIRREQSLLRNCVNTQLHHSPETPQRSKSSQREDSWYINSSWMRWDTFWCSQHPGRSRHRKPSPTLPRED